MPPEFDPFADSDSPHPWVSETPRARRVEDEAFLMSHEKTPEPELMDSIERSFSSENVDEEKSQSPFGAGSGSGPAVGTSAVGTTTIKTEDTLDGLGVAGTSVRQAKEDTMDQQSQNRARATSGLQSPTSSSSVVSNNSFQPRNTDSAHPSGLQSPTLSNISSMVNGTSNIQLQRADTTDSLTAQQRALNIDEDEDLMIIDAEGASPEAQAKWSRYQPTAPKDDVPVKPEPKDPSPAPTHPPKKPGKSMDFNRIMAAQRALLKNMQTGSSNRNNSSIFGRRSRSPNPFQNEAESSSTAASRAFILSSPRPNNEFRDDPSQVDDAMRGAEEDISWMHDESVSDDEYETLKTLHASLEKKAKSGRISGAERMELFKLGKTLQMKYRLRAAGMQRDEVEDEDEGLFVKESREDVVDRHRRNRPNRDSGSEDEEMGDGEEGEDDIMMKMLQQELNGDGLDGPGTGDVDLGLTKSGKPRKRRAKNAREYVERAEESRRQKERSKAQKKKGRAGAASAKGRKPAAKGRGKGKEKEKKKNGKKGTVKNGESLLRSGHYSRFNGTDSVGQMMLEDLMQNDPISDRLQNPIFDVEPEAPMPGQHRKESQFQMLFANIPTGDGSKANQKGIQNDKKALKEASRSFGYAKVKAKDGKWMIKGMNSTLYHHQLLGAQWMVQRELSSQPPHGGLLADSMG